MSEDEFVVLLEHAGIVETADDSAREFVEQAQLLEWLEREGIELFTSPAVLATRAADEGGNGSVSANGSVGANAIARALPALATGDGLHSNTLLGEARARLARRILERLLAREWISPIEFEYEDDETEEWKATLYTPRLTTADAYRIYIEKDPSESHLAARGWSLRAQTFRKMDERAIREQRATAIATPPSADDAQKTRIREQMWQNCFPTCSESSRQMFLSFDNPEVILYSTMGLNLISNGISSVPAYSRELKNMGVSAEDRSMIVGFLAKAFPCD